MEERDLHRKYQFDQPWDGPANSQLAARRPSAYTCPSFDHHLAEGELDARDTRHGANYVALLGSGTFFARVEESAGEQTAGTVVLSSAPQALIAMEIGSPRIHWMAPRDVHRTEAHARLHPAEEAPLNHPDGAHFLLAEGSVRFVGQGVSAQALRAWIRSGQPPADAE